MAKAITKESLIEAIAKCDKIIANQNAKKMKLEAKLAEIKKTEILNAIMNSGKTLEEVLEFVNN